MPEPSRSHPDGEHSALSPKVTAPQHRPRPLPLLLDLLQHELGEQPERLRQALAGLRRYQQAERRRSALPPPPVAETAGACLRDYGGAGPLLLVVPSLINPPTVLDLGERSLLRWLAARHRRVLLLDWGWPASERRTLSVAGHVEQLLVPLMRELGETVDLAGYCLGGTMAIAAARLEPVRSLAAIAAPWRFSAFAAGEREMLTSLWRRNAGAAEALGVLPMEVLQQAFWSLDPARTAAKFERFADLAEPEAGEFVQLEDWANDGPPLALAAARELFEDFFGSDLPGSGQWQIGGRVASPDLPCPTLAVASTADRIVPAGSTPPSQSRIETARGHVGMIVGSRAREELWEPFAAWLSRVSPN